MDADGYRLDIQGLRALAVLLVFFAHAGWTPFSGGFIGVDVFFVISGYVITAYLLREHAREGRLRLLSFYARRLQRLLPALLVMVLTVSAIAMLLLSQRERWVHTDAAGGALFWVSNLHFYFSQLDYFDNSVHKNLFLHTWTLGVEEQFYLVWPLLLSAGLAAASRRLLPALLGSVLLGTLALCLYWAGTDPNAAFYLMPARGWQFAAGGLVAWWHAGHPRAAGGLVPELTSLAGLALIMAAAVALDAHTAYPGLNAVAPTLGASLVLAGAGRVNRLFSTGPAVWLGNVSYGFYLWHWPILLFFADLQPFYPALTSALALLVTTGLAALSYYALEQPLRTSRALLARPRIVVEASVACMLAALLLVNQVASSYRWSDTAELADIWRMAGRLPKPYTAGCDGWHYSDTLKPCDYGDPDSGEVGVLLGDSFAQQWFPAVNALYRERGWRLVVLTKSACPVVNRSFYYATIRRNYDVCDSWRDKALAYIETLQPRQVIFTNSGSYPFSEREWRQGTTDILDRLSGAADDIVMIASTPELDFNGPECLVRQTRLAQVMPIRPRDHCRGTATPEPQLKWLADAASPYENVRWLDLAELICPGGICNARQGSYLVYRDRNHLTEDYVLSLRDSLDRMLAPSGRF